MNLGIGHLVIIVEDQHEIAGQIEELVAQGRAERLGTIMGKFECGERRLARILMYGLNGKHEMRDEPVEIAVGVIKGKPGGIDFRARQPLAK